MLFRSAQKKLPPGHLKCPSSPFSVLENSHFSSLLMQQYHQLCVAALILSLRFRKTSRDHNEDGVHASIYNLRCHTVVKHSQSVDHHVSLTKGVALSTQLASCQGSMQSKLLCLFPTSALSPADVASFPLVFCRKSANGTNIFITLTDLDMNICTKIRQSKLWKTRLSTFWNLTLSLHASAVS